MKKLFSVLLAAMLLIALTAGIAETATEPSAPMFTVNVTQLLIAIIGIIFNALLVWLVKTVIPPLKEWLKIHTTNEQQTRVWTMIKWLVEAAEQIITGYAMGQKRLEWVQAQLKARGIEVDRALVEAAVKEMKDKAGKEINDAIHGKDPCAGKDYCEIE